MSPVEELQRPHLPRLYWHAVKNMSDIKTEILLNIHTDNLQNAAEK